MASSENGDSRQDRHHVPRLSWDDINAELPPKTYLVRRLGFVSGGGAPHALIAYGYSGKSMLAQSLALSLAVGGLVWGAFQASTSKVVYIDLEQGEYLTRERFQRLARGMKIKEDLLRRNLQLVTRRQAADLELDIRLFKEEWRGLMAGADCIIIDSLSAATHGIDENSREMRRPLDMLMSLSEDTLCRPIIIHHAGKKKKDGGGDIRETGRGSSGIFDACDAQLILEKTDGATSGTLKFAKTRSEMRDGGFEYDIIDTVDGDLDVRVSGAQETTEDSKLVGWGKAITNALRAAPGGLSKRQLAKAAGCSARAIDASFDSLRGLVEVTEGLVAGQKAQIFQMRLEALREAFQAERDAEAGVSNVIAFPGTPKSL